MKAHEYSYSLRDDFKHSKKIKVYDTIYRDRSSDTSDFLDNTIKSIPSQCLDVFDEIEIHHAQGGKAGSFRAEPSLFSKRRVLAIYVSADGYPTKDVAETLYHELGHAIAKYIKGTANPGEKWRGAMLADGNPVSKYSSSMKYPKENDNGEIEDIAESVRLYLATNGAKTEETRLLRNFCRNRFQKLDEVFEDLSKRQRTSKFKRLISRPKNSLEK